MVRLCLEQLGAPQRACAIIRETRSANGAREIAKYSQASSVIVGVSEGGTVTTCSAYFSLASHPPGYVLLTPSLNPRQGSPSVHWSLLEHQIACGLGACLGTVMNAATVMFGSSDERSCSGRWLVQVFFLL